MVNIIDQKIVLKDTLETLRLFIHLSHNFEGLACTKPVLGARKTTTRMSNLKQFTTIINIRNINYALYCL